MTSNGIGLLNESSLHNALKEHYAGPGDLVEAVVDGFVVDVVRGNEVVEVQTGTFSAIRDKLRALLEGYRVRLVYPIAATTWILRVEPETGEVLGRRRSPRRGVALVAFHELVYIPELLDAPGFSLDLAFVEQEEVRVADGRGSWRRRGIRVVDRRLVRLVETRTMCSGRDLLALLPGTLAQPFTNRALAAEAHVPRRLAQRVTYTLARCGALRAAGVVGRERLYALSDQAPQPSAPTVRSGAEDGRAPREAAPGRD